MLTKNKMKLIYPILIVAFAFSCQSDTEPDVEVFESQLIKEENQIVNGVGIEILGSEGSFIELKLSNVSEDTVRLWEEWNSWGYYNLSFQLKSERAEFEFKKKPRAWTVNFPSHYCLRPMSDSVFLVDFKSENWELPLDSLVGGLTASFEIKADEETEVNNIWIGEVKSNSIDFKWSISRVVSIEVQKILDQLNSWDKKDMDVYETSGAYPNRKSVGETSGWVDTHKNLLLEQGVEVLWNRSKFQYEVVEK
ncbi:MAG: hypothetical protein ACI9J3_002229 [Parvicellaceae bacterium]|jgi:hypothetical protein